MNSPGSERLNERTIWLYIQNEPQSAVYRDYLEQDGYRVLTSNGSSREPEKGFQERPDVIILDSAGNLPELDAGLHPGGINGDVLVLLLAEGAAQRLNIGNVDERHHLTLKRGVRPRALSARIRDILHRKGKPAPKARQYRVGDIFLDRDKHFVQVAGQYIDLTPTEFDLLSLLMTAPGQVFSRQDLLAWLGGASFNGSKRTIDVHIRNIRAKIGAVIHPRAVIKTVYRMGYRLSVG